jgi:chitin-binding protein
MVRKIAAVGAAPFVVIGLAGPADAHGAMSNPISRAAECGPEGGYRAQSKACQAARAAGDAAALRAWDNLRVPDVNGRDRRLIPDGKLCSGGLDAYRGLDLPRRDWPATRLGSGERFTFTYRATIPHAGMFRLYITRNGYDPARRLSWADLGPRPFAAVTDPPLVHGSYVIKGRLPSAMSGRHVIFTIWQTTSTPDTYYSCSDVVFGGRSGGTGAGRGEGRQPARSAPTPRGSEAAGGADPGSGANDGANSGANDGTIDAANKSSDLPLPLVTGGGAMALALAGGATLLLARRRRRARRPAGPGPAGPGPAGQRPPG